MTVPLTGSFPQLITPMHAPGELDLAGLARLVDDAAVDGAAGVLIGGLAGEGPLLAPADRRALTVAAGETGVTVIAGAYGASLADVHADVERLAGAGADVVAVLAPAVLPLHADELVDAHLAIAERAPIATVVQHAPAVTGSALTVEAVKRLSGHPRIIGLIDASEDVHLRAEFAAFCGPSFAVLSAYTPTLLADLTAGVSGVSVAIASLRQRQVQALLTAVDEEDRDTAVKVQASLTACEAGLLIAGASLPAVIKAALQLQGRIDERWCVPPLGSVAPGRLDGVRTALLR